MIGLITEKDLREAIAECEGTRNPTSSTCMKLAAYYTILNQMTNQPKEEVIPAYSFSSGPAYEDLPYTNSDFSQEVMDKGIDRVFPVLDELMDALMVVNPKLYRSTMTKLSDL